MTKSAGALAAWSVLTLSACAEVALELPETSGLLVVIPRDGQNSPRLTVIEDGEVACPFKVNESLTIDARSEDAWILGPLDPVVEEALPEPCDAVVKGCPENDASTCFAPEFDTVRGFDNGTWTEGSEPPSHKRFVRPACPDAFRIGEGFRVGGPEAVVAASLDGTLYVGSGRTIRRGVTTNSDGVLMNAPVDIVDLAIDQDGLVWVLGETSIHREAGDVFDDQTSMVRAAFAEPERGTALAVLEEYIIVGTTNRVSAFRSGSFVTGDASPHDVRRTTRGVSFAGNDEAWTTYGDESRKTGLANMAIGRRYVAATPEAIVAGHDGGYRYGTHSEDFLGDPVVADVAALVDVETGTTGEVLVISNTGTSLEFRRAGPSEMSCVQRIDRACVDIDVAAGGRRAFIVCRTSNDAHVVTIDYPE